MRRAGQIALNVLTVVSLVTCVGTAAALMAGASGPWRVAVGGWTVTFSRGWVHAERVDRVTGVGFAVLPWFLAGATLAVGTAIARRLTRNRADVGLCPRCRYDLTGNVSGVCPECGTAVAGKGAA